MLREVRCLLGSGSGFRLAESGGVQMSSTHRFKLLGDLANLDAVFGVQIAREARPIDSGVATLCRGCGIPMMRNRLRERRVLVEVTEPLVCHIMLAVASVPILYISLEYHQ